MDTTEEQLKLLLKLETEELRNQLIESLTSSEEGLGDVFQDAKNKICVDWGYCTQKENLEKIQELQLAKQVATLVIGIIDETKLTLLAAYLVRFGLDKLCDCK